MKIFRAVGIRTVDHAEIVHTLKDRACCAREINCGESALMENVAMVDERTVQIYASYVARIIDVKRFRLHGAGDIDRRKGSLIQRKTVNHPAGVTIGAHNLSLVV